MGYRSPFHFYMFFCEILRYLALVLKNCYYFVKSMFGKLCLESFETKENFIRDFLFNKVWQIFSAYIVKYCHIPLMREMGVIFP